MTLWTWVIVAGAAFWSDGSELESRLRAASYPVGTRAAVCQTNPWLCVEYVAQDVILRTEPVQVKARMWVRPGEQLLHFDAADPRFGAGSFVEIGP